MSIDAKRFLLAITVCAATLSALPATSSAQAEASPPGNAISANPFLLLFEWFNAEWEHRLAPNASLGVSAARFSVNDGADVYTSLNGLARLYPQERAPSGFFVGGRLGVHRLDLDTIGEGESAFGIGIEVGYTWLLGSNQNYVVSLGLGVTRLFADEGESALPGLRLVNVGWAF